MEQCCVHYGFAQKIHYFSEGKMDINFVFDLFWIAPIENNSLLNDIYIYIFVGL
jgi:hypothetical protein